MPIQSSGSDNIIKKGKKKQTKPVYNIFILNGFLLNFYLFYVCARIFGGIFIKNKKLSHHVHPLVNLYCFCIYTFYI